MSVLVAAHLSIIHIPRIHQLRMMLPKMETMFRFMSLNYSPLLKKFTTCYSILSRLKFTWYIYLQATILCRVERNVKMLILANMKDALSWFHICVWLMILKHFSKKSNRSSSEAQFFWYCVIQNLIEISAFCNIVIVVLPYHF